MRLIHSITELRSVIQESRQAGKAIGFVPTMGNLHAGHLDLVKRANALSGFSVVSIFVNPTQFDQQDDLDKYPRTLEADLAQLEALGVDVVFAPDAKTMYPHGKLVTHVDVPAISQMLEGHSRPGHFRGVATVVTKLLNIVLPDIAVFGQKDYQQLLLIRQMVADLDIPVDIIAAPTMREADGLAMSSRNNRLTASQRSLAPRLSESLDQLTSAVQLSEQSFDALQSAAINALNEQGFQTDYIRICHADTLQLASREDKRLVILAAAYLGAIRLIDNRQVSLSEDKQ